MQGSGVTDTQFAGDSPSLSNSQRSEGNLLPIDALVMKGGGVKGLAFAGAVRELQAYFQFEAFVGTSAGAIAAALFAAGATGAMLEETLRRKRFRDFLDGRFGPLLSTFGSLEEFIQASHSVIGYGTNCIALYGPNPNSL